MYQRIAEPGAVARLPDRTRIADLLRKYSEPLLSSCPSSETLVILHEEPNRLSDCERETVDSHLDICLDCRDKLRWLEASETSGYPVSFTHVVWYVLSVRHPGEAEGGRLSALARSRGQGGAWTPRNGRRVAAVKAAARKTTVPYFVSGDGALCGEIRTDRRRRMYLRLHRMPRSFQWHALHIRALTFDRRLLVSGTRTISSPNFPINHPPRIAPDDLDRVELGLVPLR